MPAPMPAITEAQLAALGTDAAAWAQAFVIHDGPTLPIARIAKWFAAAIEAGHATAAATSKVSSPAMASLASMVMHDADANERELKLAGSVLAQAQPVEKDKA